MTDATRAPASIDVLVPAYNAGATIADTVRSLQQQTVSDIRIIVVDDGSTDDTPQILARLAASDPRIEIKRKTNGGIVDARNHGLTFCNAEFVAGLDADDISFPTRLEEQRRYLLANPDCAAVDCHYLLIDEQGQRTGQQTETEGDVSPNAFSIPSKEPYLMHPFLMVRAEALRTVGGYREAIYAEDVDLYWRLLPVGRLHHLPMLLGSYRVHSGSSTSASILNGRISAVNSHLAALSHRRRIAGAADIGFGSDKLDRYKKAETLRGIIDVASEQLSVEEAAYLEVAACAKLMTLSVFRPYVPDVWDVETIISVLRERASMLTPHDAAAVEKARAKLTVKLLRRRHWKSAAMLSPGALPLGRILTERAARKAKHVFARIPA